MWPMPFLVGCLLVLVLILVLYHSYLGTLSNRQPSLSLDAEKASAEKLAALRAKVGADLENFPLAYKLVLKELPGYSQTGEARKFMAESASNFARARDAFLSENLSGAVYHCQEACRQLESARTIATALEAQVLRAARTEANNAVSAALLDPNK